MDNFEQFAEQVRDANPIEGVLQESGISLRGHGRLRTAANHDSMKVRVDYGRVFWYSQNWNGDVFGWVMRDKGYDFPAALEHLARRANLEMPKFQRRDEGDILRARATADVFSVAANVFHRWLVGDAERGVAADAEALAYARGRGWSDETLNSALIGFSGRKSAEQIADMKGEFSLCGIDPLSPAAVAVIGFQGDVDKWARERDVRDHEDFDDGWVVKGRIHGLMDVPGIIYAHQHKGGVNYLSRRHLPGHDKITDKETGNARDWKSFNPYKLLAGPKQVYWNHAHRTDRPLIGVEGQGDAVTYGQWGYGAVAFCGLMGDIQNMTQEDAERMTRLASYIQKHAAFHLFMDDDAAGQKTVWQAAKIFGPKMLVGRMTRLVSRDEANNVE